MGPTDDRRSSSGSTDGYGPPGSASAGGRRGGKGGGSVAQPAPGPAGGALTAAARPHGVAAATPTGVAVGGPTTRPQLGHAPVADGMVAEHLGHCTGCTSRPLEPHPPTDRSAYRGGP